MNDRALSLKPLEERLISCMESLNKIDSEIVSLINKAEISTTKSKKSTKSKRSRTKSKKKQEN